MKNIIKKVKGKKVLSFVLAAIMLATTFNMALPMLKLDASAESLGGITQTRVVSDYKTKYAEYANRFFGGEGKSEPTNFVIPGLSQADDYTPQGMTYWKAKDWILISAYDASGAGKHSVIYALDGKSTEFVALFKVLNADGSVNTSHGGGIAASEYNFYYADEGSKISYVPLSEMDVAPGTVKEIKLKGSINCAGELNGVATSYCCYDEGVLWTGNFYISSDDKYNKKAYDTNPSVLMGYKLRGNSSEEEWHYLSTNNNVAVNLNSTSEQTAGVMKYTTNYSLNGRDIEITGNITTSTSIGELTANFATFTLTEGKKYKIEFIADNNLSDIYMFAPTGNHCNVKQSQSSKITQLSDGRYHYQMVFTAGLKPTGADSSWPTTQSTDSTYTGTYTMRFDQDSITGNRSFSISNLAISNYTGTVYDSNYEGINCVGNPTYCVVFDSALDRIQYAMVDNGRIYISRSWSRSESTNHIRQLVVGEIDLNSPGKKTFAVNGITRACHYVDDSKMTKFGGGSGSKDMFYMGEALCVMEGYLYMFAESAAWTYNGKGDKCPEPIDVIWRIDQYAIMGEFRETDNEKLQYYEQVTSLDQIKNTGNNLDNTDEYIIVYESSQKDPVTQKNILYALDAFGGHNGNKLPKEGVNEKDYIYGIVGHPITEYNIENGDLYLTNPEKDDVENIRWKFYGSQGNYDIQSTSLYYSTYKSLCLNGMETSMAKDASAKFTLDFTAEGNLLLHTGEQYIWCNDGTNGYENAINKKYASSGFSYTEESGTFHANATYKDGYGIVGKAVPDDLRELKIYKRVLDPYAEKEMSKVYTNSTATLQPDGTYTIDMETYAINPTHYRIFDEQRPTDFILVLDASASMENNKDTGMTGYKRWSSVNELSIESVAGKDATAKPGSAQIHGYEFSQGNIYYRTDDGVYRQLYAAVRTTSRSLTSCKQSYWVYYKDDAGLCWVLCENGTIYDGITFDQLKTNVANDANRSANVSSNSNDTRKNERVWRGVHYSKNHELTRFDVMRTSVESLIDKIAAEAKATGMKYRVAVVQFGSTAAESYYNTGMYKNDGSFVQYSGSNSISAGNYVSTFFDVTNATSLQKLKYQVIANIENAEGKDADTYSNHGYEMANNIISNYSGRYDATGDRSACILMITDGIPSTGKNASDKETVANDAINQVLQAKEKGAYSYTVQMGNSSGDWSSMGTYIEALSSEYLQAQNLTNLGEKNSDQIDYARNIDTNGFNLDKLSEELFLHITANSRIGLAQLGTGSILRQTLSDKFYAPFGQAKVQYLFADGYYDGLGRLDFRNESDATTSGVTGKAITATDSEGNQYYKYLDVTGFDYKNYYISKTHEGGKKLIVRITGVLPRTTSLTDGSELSHINSAISNNEDTGIYQNETMLAASEEFKHFPNETFTIPEYTYVLDYGLYMLDTDVNGTLCSVSDTLSKQSTYKYISENGAVAIDRASRNQNLLYSLSPDKTTESGYVLIQRDDGTYDWFKINVVPASNVYFEEDDMDIKEADKGTSKSDWAIEGSPTKDYRDLTEEGDVVGFENAYNIADQLYSNGTVKKAYVSASQRNSKTQTFDFVGTGFDLVSRCGSETGILLVNIKNSAGKSIAASIVDTYCEAGTFNQTPVFSWTGGYGTYTVEVSAMYLSTAGALNPKSKSINKSSFIDTGLEMKASDSFNTDVLQAMLDEAGVEDVSAKDVELIWFDDNSIFNGGTGVAPTKKGTRNTKAVTELVNYIDGFRVYNPLGTGESVYTEKNVSYANVIDNLAALENPEKPENINGIAFITGLGDGVTSLSYAQYQQSGPKGELYLNTGKSISFKINRGANEKVMLGLRAVNGATTIKVNGHDIVINSATEMYYDISHCITGSGEVTITVNNAGSKIAAINQIKFSGGNASNGSVINPRSMARSTDATAATINKFLPLTQEDLVAIESVMNAEPIPTVVKNGVVIPLVEEEEEIPEDNTNTDNDNTNTDNDNTNDGADTEESEKEEFGIFSLIEMLLSLIEKILRNAFSVGSIG